MGFNSGFKVLMACGLVVWLRRFGYIVEFNGLWACCLAAMFRIHLLPTSIERQMCYFTYVRRLTGHSTVTLNTDIRCVTTLRSTTDGIYDGGPITLYFFLWRCDPTRVMASSILRFIDHTQRRTTVGRNPLDD